MIHVCRCSFSICCTIIHCLFDFWNTLNNTASHTAVGLGAKIFEKHITLDKKSEGPDHFYAMEPKEFKVYVSTLKDAFKSLGSPNKKMLLLEKKLGRREGLYASRNLNKGYIIKEKDLKINRPAVGIRSRYINAIIGAKLRHSIKKDEPVYWVNIK